MDNASRTSNKSLITELRRRRDYSNPYFLRKMVETYGINELGTCFAKDVWDPAALAKEDYADAYDPFPLARAHVLSLLNHTASRISPCT